MGLDSVDHVVVLMLENRSFDHMLGNLYAAQGNKSPLGQDFDGLTGSESNPDGNGNQVPVFEITSQALNPYWMPLCNPGEGYQKTNQQLFGIDPAARRRSRRWPPIRASSRTSPPQYKPRHSLGINIHGPAHSRPASWGCTRRRPCRFSRPWRRVSPCATAGSRPRRRRPSPTEPLPWRRRHRDISPTTTTTSTRAPPSTGR